MGLLYVEVTMKGVIMANYYRIGEFANLIGKSSQTLRNWDRNGTLKPAVVNENGRKLYSKEQLDQFIKNEDRLVIGFCRVNRKSRSYELERQVQLLKEYMDDQDWNYQIISDVGSGLDYKRKGLSEVLSLVLEHKVAKLIAVRRDSLVRYGYELIETICKANGCDVEYMEDIVDSDDYCSDIASIIKFFNYDFEGKRADKAKRKIREFIAQ